MFCCIIMCIFLTNVLQNLRERTRISEKLLDGGTRHGHTLSQPAHNVEQPAKGHSNVLDDAKQKRKKGRRGRVWELATG